MGAAMTLWVPPGARPWTAFCSRVAHRLPGASASGLPGGAGGFGECLDPFQADPHAVQVGAAAREPSDHPVQAHEWRVGQLERLGDIGAPCNRFQLVAPRVHGRPARSGHREGELAAQIARHHRAGSPVHRPHAVAPDMTAETRPHPGPAYAAEPLRLKGLGTELPDPGDVTDQIPDLVSRCRHVNCDRTTHHPSVRGHLQVPATLPDVEMKAMDQGNGPWSAGAGAYSSSRCCHGKQWGTPTGSTMAPAERWLSVAAGMRGEDGHEFRRLSRGGL